MYVMYVYSMFSRHKIFPYHLDMGMFKKVICIFTDFLSPLESLSPIFTSECKDRTKYRHTLV